MDNKFLFTINKNINDILIELKEHRVKFNINEMCHLETIRVVADISNEELIQINWIGSVDSKQFSIEADYCQDGTVSNTSTVIYHGNSNSFLDEKNIPEIINNAKHI